MKLGIQCRECELSLAKFICEDCKRHICDHCYRDGKCVSCL